MRCGTGDCDADQLRGLQDGAKLADIPVEDISDYLCGRDCFVWVALPTPSPDELAKMQEEFGLHELAVEDARNGHQRPKIEEYGDSLFAVLHLVELAADDPDELERSARSTSSSAATTSCRCRNRSQQGFLGVRERAEREPDLLRHGAGFVLYALMDAVVDRYFPIIDALESELETIEAQIFDKGPAAPTSSSCTT